MDEELKDQPTRGSAELKAIVEALIFASPEPLTPKAMFKVLDSEPREDVLAAIEERIEQLLAKLSETEACGFEDLFADVQTRAGLIVTFLALLEMIRLKLVRVFQSGAVGPIRVYKRAKPADAPSFGNLGNSGDSGN